MQGGEPSAIESLSRGDLAEARLEDNEHRLLEFVEKLTKESYKVVASDSENLRDALWTDEQIAEAVYITALFAFFNRVADAFGLENPRYRDPEADGQPR